MFAAWPRLSKEAAVVMRVIAATASALPPSRRRLEASASGPTAARKKTARNQGADEEGLVEGDHGAAELESDPVAGAVFDCGHEAERGDAEGRVDGRRGCADRAEDAAAEFRAGPDREGDEEAEAEELEVGAGPDHAAGRGGERFRDLRGAAGGGRDLAAAGGADADRSEHADDRGDAAGGEEEVLRLCFIVLFLS
jgi:hypothetical protein